MSDRHPDGFLRHPRRPLDYRDPAERIHDYREVYAPDWDPAQLRVQGERCMDCGTPTCMAGCPIGNLIPEWNDLVSCGSWREALERLHATNNFPEFTGYTCPAPCEPACTLAVSDAPVTIKNIERAIVDMGWREGWIRPEPPARRSGFRVAVVGSGPAGLACAQQLNRAGHAVVVFERDDAIGGLMSYGIPDFKFDKRKVARRVAQLAQEGIGFRTGVEVGRDPSLAALRGRFDAVCLAIGAGNPREVAVPGRTLGGVELAMDFLTAENRRQAGLSVARPIDARELDVVVLGGGDTGADCVATAHRQGARSVTQVSIRDRPPERRDARHPWPWLPMTYATTYALEEGGQDVYGLNALAFLDENGAGRVDAVLAERVAWRYDAGGRRLGKRVLESGIRLPAELVLIAVGFSGPRLEALAGSGLEVTPEATLARDPELMTALPGVFAAGDAAMGQSIVVWAIGEGRDAARSIDLYLTGETRLPCSLRTPNPPLHRR
jgi:glutamate synthase (NADPH/NADH) small chain